MFSTYCVFGVIFCLHVATLLGKSVIPTEDENGDVELRAATITPLPILMRIVPVQAGEYPFVVALEVQKQKEDRTCTGSIISEDNVLTTATCIEGADKVTVYVDCLELEFCNTTFTGSSIIHPYFQVLQGVAINNIGIVILTNEIPKKMYVPANTEGGLPPYGAECIMNTFINTILGGNPTRRLMKFKIESILPCHQIKPDFDMTYIRFFCATGKDVQEFPTEHYGGPIICGVIQLAIASQAFMGFNANGTRMDVLTIEPISMFTEWIQTSSTAPTPTLLQNVIPRLVITFTILYTI